MGMGDNPVSSLQAGRSEHPHASTNVAIKQLLCPFSLRLEKA